MGIYHLLKLLFRRLSISILTVIITLIGIEFVIRWVPLYPDDLSVHDPEIGFVNIPNAKGIHLNPGCWFDYRQKIIINSKGIRDHEMPYQRTEKYRILILGDSFLEALQVPLENTFHVMLEKSLDIEVVAGGHGGWGTDAELLWYRKEGQIYHPDLVILLFQPGNDVLDNSLLLNYYPYKNPYFTLEQGNLVFHLIEYTGDPSEREVDFSTSKAHKWFLENSDLYKLFMLRQRRQQLVDGTVLNLVERDAIIEEQDVEKDVFKVLYDETYNLTIALIQQIHMEVLENGSQFGVVIASSDKQVFSGGDNHRLTASLELMQIDYLDLLPAIKASHSDESPAHFLCDGHWTKSGHLVVAEALTEFLAPYVDDKE